MIILLCWLVIFWIVRCLFDISQDIIYRWVFACESISVIIHCPLGWFWSGKIISRIMILCPLYVKISSYGKFGVFLHLYKRDFIHSAYTTHLVLPSILRYECDKYRAYITVMISDMPREMWCWCYDMMFVIFLSNISTKPMFPTSLLCTGSRPLRGWLFSVI